MEFMHLYSADFISEQNATAQEGRGSALVETMTFKRRVVGSTPALAAR